MAGLGETGLAGSDRRAHLDAPLEIRNREERRIEMLPALGEVSGWGGVAPCGAEPGKLPGRAGAGSARGGRPDLDGGSRC